jgi:hypothetical protein
MVVGPEERFSLPLAKANELKDVNHPFGTIN